MKKILPRPIRRYFKFQKVVIITAIFSLLANSFSPLIVAFAQESSESAGSTTIQDSLEQPTEAAATTEPETSTSSEDVSATTNEPEVVEATTEPTSEPVQTSEPTNESTTETSTFPSETPIVAIEETILIPDEQILVTVTSPSPDQSLVTEETEQTLGSESTCILSDAAVVLSNNSYWDVSGDVATTKEKVKIGVRYEFPLEEGVSVTFKCLPSDETLVSNLRIERVRISDLDLPSGLDTSAEYAFDITSEMTNGTFEYDISLPKPEGLSAEIVYVEDSLDNILNNGISETDVNQLEGEEQEGNEVRAKGVDHFTLLISLYTPVYTYIDDSSGANDEPGQKDLTRLGRDTSVHDPLYITWNWDEISMSGNNTADACALFDTDNDGMVNYSLCVTWGQNQSQLSTSPTLYSCNDTRVDRCSGATEVTSALSTTCSVQNTTDDPFTSGAAYPNDTNTSCVIPLSDVGGAIQANLLDVCSYPSEQPNSDPSDCVIIQTDKGTLTIIKDVVPNNTSTNWNFSVSGSINFNTSINGGDGSSGINNVPLGTYSITETAGANTSLSGYDTTWSCIKNGSAYLSGTGTTASGIEVQKTGSVLDSIVCTFTNSIQQAHLTVNKVVVNDNGGTKVISDFPLFIDGNSVTSGQSNVVSLGSHTVSETNLYGYSAEIGGDCAANGTITLSSGDNKICTITNNDVQPKLTVTKVVNNTHGGTRIVSDFPLFVGATQVISGVQNSFNAAIYTVSETNQSGYLASITGDCDSNGNVTLNVGDEKACTITNSDQAATLIVKKVVINDDGGNKTASEFTFRVNSGNPVTFEVDGQNDLTVDAGTYTIVEPEVSGYATTYDNCTNLVISNGGTSTCTITNNDIQPKLTVIKHVVNQNGGTAVAGDFTMSVTGTNVSPSSFSGNESGTLVTLNSGTYLVSENGPSGYAPSYSADCSGSISIGQEKTCTVTNGDQAATLRIVKHVINDNGGNAVAGDFTINVLATNSSQSSFAGSEAGVSITLNAGSYSVDEGAHAGYAKSLSADCSGTIANGQSKTCTITNNDIQPKLTVTKRVSGGNAQVSDFPLFVNSTQVASGVQNGFNVGSYTVNETNQIGYTGIITGDCDSNGNVSLAVNDVKACTITNIRDTGTITVIKDVVPNDSSEWDITVSGLTNNSETLSDQEQTSAYTSDTGSYTVSEAPHTGTIGQGYTSSYNCYDGTNNIIGSGTSVNFTLNKNQNMVCTFTNTKLGGILGFKYEDFNSNGSYDETENKLSGWTIDLKDLQNIVIASTQTDVNGNYQFNQVALGTYNLCEQNQVGWTQINPSNGCFANVVVEAGNSLTYDFGNFQNISVTACKVEDGDGNANTTNDQTPVTDWPVYLVTDNNTEQRSSALTGRTGCYTWTNLGSNHTYSVGEDVLTGWTNITPTSFNFESYTSGEQLSHTFINYRYSSLSGTKFEDLNGNGIFDQNESGLQGWTINLSHDNSVTNTTTDASGNYTFSNLVPGDYTVYETGQDGWIQTAGNAEYNQTITSNSSINGINFGNFHKVSVTACKLDDTDGNPQTLQDQTPISGWTVYLTQDEQIVDTKVTGGNGCYTWNDLGQGFSYGVGEQTLDNWKTWTDVTHDFGLAQSGQTYSYNFVNTQYAKAIVKLVTSPSDPTIFSVTGDVSGNISDGGSLEGSTFLPGTYNSTFHTSGDWTIDEIICDDSDSSGTVATGDINFALAEGETTTCTVYISIPPVFEISKSNDTNGDDQNSGDLVKYTIQVFVTNNGLNDVRVIDLLPEGFEFQSDGWSATSNLQGVLSISTPTYHSPGIWTLGDLSVGEIVTLEYFAKVGGSVDPGEYKDLAFASGQAPNGTDINALSLPEGFVSENFVGTSVNVAALTPDVEVEVEENIVREEVLGASTSLPATGSNLVWLFLTVGFLIGGVYFLLKGSKFMKGLKTILMVMFVAVALTFPSKAATSGLELRVEEPAATANGPFDITFVILDLQADRDITAECFKKAPTDGDFVQFGSDIAIAQGGDTKVCSVTDDILDDNGTYQFKVKVTAGEDSVESSPQSVDFNGNRPSKPKYIEKDKKNSCKYEVTFRTANDGQTTYVEIYRDDDKTIEVNDGSRIRTIIIGPDERYSFIDELSGDCDTPYYAIRAFNSDGVASNPRAEEIEKTETTTIEGETTQESGAIATTGGTLGGTGIGGETGQQGEVAGETTTTTLGQSTEPSQTGVVAGVSTAVSNLAGLLKKWWFWAIVVLLLGAYYRFGRKAK